jgi:hypothetical protein
MRSGKGSDSIRPAMAPKVLRIREGSGFHYA